MNLNRKQQKESPCYQCKDRYIGCHSNCQIYQQFKLYTETEREARKLRSMLNNDLREIRDLSIKRALHGGRI